MQSVWSPNNSIREQKRPGVWDFIRTCSINRWAKELQSQDAQVFRRNGKLTAEQEENQKLKSQVKRLKMEKEIFKKNDGILCSLNDMKYSFITQHKIPIPSACSVRPWVSIVPSITTIGRQTDPSIPCTRRSLDRWRLSRSTLARATALVGWWKS